MLSADEHAAEASTLLDAANDDLIDPAETQALAQMAMAHYLGALVATRGERVVAELDTTVTRIEPEPSAIHAKRIHELETDIRELVADAATTRERFENERDAFRGVLSDLVDALADGWPDEYDREGESPVVPALRKARDLLAKTRSSFPYEDSTSGDSLGSDQVTVMQQPVPSTGEVERLRRVLLDVQDDLRGVIVGLGCGYDHDPDRADQYAREAHDKIDTALWAEPVPSTGEDQRMPLTCARCGHPDTEHGFPYDIECDAEGCICGAFEPVPDEGSGTDAG